jgi:membrane protein XagC
MNPAIPVAVVMAVIFEIVFLISKSATRVGLVPDDAVTLWANAITAGDGLMPIGRIVAAYPTLPFLATTLLEFLTPSGTPTPVLLTASIMAVFAGALFAVFRRAGISLTCCGLMVFLVVLHPAVLRAAIAGPAEMMLAVFSFLLGRALFDLRARSGAREVMAVALSLLGVAFSHPMGAAIACAAIPLFVFSVRPEMLASRALNLVLVLVFPTAFCVAAFCYTAWVFPGSGWSFLVAPTEGVAMWAAGFSGMFGGGPTGWLVLDAGIAVLVAQLLAAPLIPAFLVWFWGRRPLVAPVMVIVAMTVLAASLAVLTRLFGDPAPLAVMPPLLAAIVIVQVQALRERLVVVMALLVVGWFGGLAGLILVDPRGATNLYVVLKGHEVDGERLAAIELGNATVGRDGILVDTFNAPAIVLGRGYARGLFVPSDEAFALDVLFSRIDAPFVAVPDPLVGIGASDRLNRAFPRLYRSGAAGYRMIYDKANWRLFART